MPISTPNPSGDRVRALRGRQGLSQAELARKAEISPTTVATLETGGRHVRPATVRRIARALGVATGELFDPDPKAPEPEPLDAWGAAVNRARSLREDGRERLEELVEAWRGRGDASGGGSAALLGRMKALLQEAHEAERELRSAGADGRPGAPGTDDYIGELQEASRYYGELRGRIEGAGLRVRRDHRVEDLAA